MIDLVYLNGDNLTFEEFNSFVCDTENDFVPPLCSRINVHDFFFKLQNNAHFITCMHNDRIVGLIAFYCNDFELRTSYVTFIAVLPEYRGNGIATVLLEKASKIATEKGMNKMKIDTNNKIAYQCYLKNGFRLQETVYLSEYKLNRYFLEKEL